MLLMNLMDTRTHLMGGIIASYVQSSVVHRKTNIMQHNVGHQTIACSKISGLSPDDDA